MDRSASNLQNPDSLSCWCLSKGMAGMVSQLTGLAEAVGMRPICKTVRLALPWRWMPTGLIPWRMTTITEPRLLSSAAPPKLVLSCGRHGVAPALALKRKFGERLLAVHIQDPKIDPAAFDLVVVPQHDRLRGPNVLVTRGAIHHVSAKRLAEARKNSMFAEMTTGDRPLVAVLVGGPNGCYRFDESDIDRFVDALHRLTSESNARLVLLPSNRTPSVLRSRLHHEFGKQQYVWDGTAPNPYLTAIASASHVVVTGDSVSMVTEAAATGRPVFVFHLTERRRTKRFRAFHAMFQQDGVTRPFEGKLADWNYKPPNDTPRIAAILRERIPNDDASQCASQHDQAA